MSKKNNSLTFENLVATDGFYFSGSSLINDIFKECGYIVPENVRADELLYTRSNFSWPQACNDGYTINNRISLFLKLLKTIILRIPLNFLQKTVFYEKYLEIKGRSDKLHQSTSVNRSIWSYLLSLYMVSLVYRFDEPAFCKWLARKYKWQTKKNKNLLLDNGIPSDKKIAKWFFDIGNSCCFYVYRNPRIQYQQICEYHMKTNLDTPTYSEFLEQLESQYSSMTWMLDTNYSVLMISFDEFLENLAYRNQLENYFLERNLLKTLEYDYSRSIDNNTALKSVADCMPICELDLAKERIIHDYHKFFKKICSQKLKYN